MRSVLVPLVCAYSAIAGGCASAVIMGASVTAGVGLATSQAEAYINGELKAARMVPLEMAEHATLLALAQFETIFRVHKQEKDRIYIMAKADGGTDIRVSMLYRTPVLTKFEIRVGMMGDQAVSSLIMSQIDLMLAGGEVVTTKG